MKEIMQARVEKSQIVKKKSNLRINLATMEFFYEKEIDFVLDCLSIKNERGVLLFFVGYRKFLKSRYNLRQNISKITGILRNLSRILTKIQNLWNLVSKKMQ